jgi:type III restriction enzyme
MDKCCSSRETMLLQDVLASGFEDRSTVFINWELITKKGNKAITDSERKIF